MKGKGFTLIELLAVIVILAIIALIATPIVLNIIKDSKESARIQSAEFYMSAVEQSIAKEMMDGKSIIPGTYNIMKDGNLCLEIDGDSCKSGLIKVDISGETPKEGKISIGEKEVEGAVVKYPDEKILKYENNEVAESDQETFESFASYLIDADVEYAFDEEYSDHAAYLIASQDIMDKFQLNVDYDFIIDDKDVIELTGIIMPDMGFTLYFKNITDMYKEGAELHAVIFGEEKLTFLTTKEITGKHNVKIGNPRPIEERMFYHIDDDGDIAMTSLDFVLGSANILIKDNEGTIYYNEVIELEENGGDGIIGADWGCRDNLPRLPDVYTALNNGKIVTIEVKQTVNGKEVISTISRDLSSMIYFSEVYLSSNHPMALLANSGC